MDAASRHLLSKFDVARGLLEVAPAAGADPEQTATLAGELSAVEVRFALATSHLVLQAALGGEAGRSAANAEFVRTLAAEDFSGEVDRVLARCEAALRATGAPIRSAGAPSRASSSREPPAKRGRGGAGGARGGPKGRADKAALAEAQRLLDIYPAEGEAGGAGPAGGAVQSVDFESCQTCGGDMIVDPTRSVLRCADDGCGTLRELVGTVFDDAQFYSQEGQKAKSGTFNPNRHFQFWWTHILAREPEEEIGDKNDPENQYGERLLSMLRAIVVRDGQVLQLLTVYDVRNMLDEVGRTDLNKNTSLLLKKLTGVGPPQLPDSVAARVENLFTKGIEIGERVRRAERVNRNYYPYYIMKILEELLPPDDADSRRIFYYIYVQSKETVEADDNDWELICDELGEVRYRPTDRGLGLRYGPA